MKSLVSIPTVRNPEVISDYAKNAQIHSFDTGSLYFLIITEDHSDKATYKKELVKNGLEGEVMGLSERDSFMKQNKILEYSDLIPKRSHAETSFGLVYMLANNEFEYGIFIDDDTKPINSHDYFGCHLKNLEFSGKIDSISSNNNWVNVLYQTFNQHKLYPRGYPYSKMGEKIEVKKKEISKGGIYLSHGLWTNVPDLDAIRILMDGDLNGQAKTRLDEKHFKENFVAEKASFQTVCSMNLAFRREIIPAFYQFPMDDNPYKVGRFDDIWSGLVVKAVLDNIDGYIMNGAPLCQHNKAPRSTFKDVSSESPGYESNEFISDTIKSVKFEGSNISEMSDKIGEALEKEGRTEFTKYCGRYLRRWVELCQKLQ